MEYWFTLCIKNNIKKEKPTPWKIYFSIKTKNNNKHKTGALKTLNKRMVKKKAHSSYCEKSYCWV